MNEALKSTVNARSLAELHHRSHHLGGRYHYKIVNGRVAFSQSDHCEPTHMQMSLPEDGPVR
jgi:hypothetical protein